MLLIDVIPQGVDPLRLQLWFLNMWIQIHDLPNGFMSEAVGKQLGNFFGEFLLYDNKNNSSIWRECMRIKIRIDVRKPLKRKKKITRKNGTDFTVTYKYERLGNFCFSCGLVTHTDRFCRRFIDKRGQEELKDWGAWLRATPRRVAGQERSKRLREENDPEWEARIERENNGTKLSGGFSGEEMRELVVRRDSGKELTGRRESRDFDSKSKFKNKLVSDKGGISSSIGPLNNKFIPNGPESDEDTGLNLEDRKRRRSGPATKGTMDVEGGIKLNDENEILRLTQGTVVSELDYAITTHIELAELALQASHSS